MKAVGIVLVVLGLVGVIWGGISWTRDEKVVDIGPLEIEAEQRESLPIPPIAGGLCVLAGAALIVAGRRG
jgi:hypothetical protein